MEQTLFEKKIKPVLTYIGVIGASLMAIAYIIVVLVLINGFEVNDILQTTTFGIVNAIVGFVIMQFLKVQGESFARELSDNKEVLDKYFKTRTKDKKNHSMTYYWVTSVIKDIFTKGVSIALTSIGIVYIVIVGSHDYNLLLLAFVNLIMFICFGLLALVKTYDYFNQSYIPYLRDKLMEGENQDA